MFIAGFVVGAVGASFFMGLRSDDPESIGRGIAHMIESSKNRFQATEPEPAEAPQARPSTEFDFYMLLPEIEHVVPDTGEDPPPANAATTPAAPPADSS